MMKVFVKIRDFFVNIFKFFIRLIKRFILVIQVCILLCGLFFIISLFNEDFAKYSSNVNHYINSKQENENQDVKQLETESSTTKEPQTPQYDKVVYLSHNIGKNVWNQDVSQYIEDLLNVTNDVKISDCFAFDYRNNITIQNLEIIVVKKIQTQKDIIIKDSSNAFYKIVNYVLLYAIESSLDKEANKKIKAYNVYLGHVKVRDFEKVCNESMNEFLDSDILEKVRNTCKMYNIDKFLLFVQK